MKIKTNYDGCPYITAGKEYPVKKDKYGDMVIEDDNGINLDISDINHALDDAPWEIVEGRFSQEVARRCMRCWNL